MRRMLNAPTEGQVLGPSWAAVRDKVVTQPVPPITQPLGPLGLEVWGHRWGENMITPIIHPALHIYIIIYIYTVSQKLDKFGTCDLRLIGFNISKDEATEGL